jgi:hypothetical protein
MQQTPSSDEVIEALVMLNCGEHGSSREKFLFRESLRNLVRLAKAEEAEAMMMAMYQVQSAHDDENVVH